MRHRARNICIVIIPFAFSSCHQTEYDNESIIIPQPRSTQVYNSQLHDELLEMARADQSVRKLSVSDTVSTDPLHQERMRKIDAENTARLKVIVHEFGWPTHSLAGVDGANAAWLLVQHTMDFEFQENCCSLMGAAVVRKEASPVDLAFLIDRIRIHSGQPQIYGTQLHRVEGALRPFPIENEAGVDDRRKALGLSSLSEYIKQAHR